MSNFTVALSEAVEAAGGQTALARLLDPSEEVVKQQNVWSWLNSTKKAPGEWVIPIERATGVSRHDLRPDLYPDEA